MKEAIDCGFSAFSDLKALSSGDRAGYLLKAASILEEDKEQVARILHLKRVNPSLQRKVKWIVPFKRYGFPLKQ